jgi:putative hemolysin
MIFKISIIILLIIANGLLAISEMSIASARKSRLQQLEKEGNSGAKIALELANGPNRFRLAVKVGIVIIGTLVGILGGLTLTGNLALGLKQVNLIAPYSEPISISILVLCITYLTLFLNELIPKRLVQRNPENIASALAPFMRLLSFIASPFVFVLDFSNKFVNRLIGIGSSAESSVTEEEIKVLIDQGTDAGVFEEAEQDIVERVFRLGDKRAGALMTPRSEIVLLDVKDATEEIKAKISGSGRSYSLFPVIEDNLDRVLGVVQAKDLLSHIMKGQHIDLKEAMLPPLFVPDSMKALIVLERFKETGIHLALVIDEYGVVQGLLTITDLLEALVGDIPHIDELKEPEKMMREDGSWLIDGMMPIDEFKDIFEIKYLPNEDCGLCHTVGGYVTMRLERIPFSGDSVEWNGFRFEILSMDANRVNKLLVVPPKPLK